MPHNIRHHRRQSSSRSTQWSHTNHRGCQGGSGRVGKTNRTGKIGKGTLLLLTVVVLAAGGVAYATVEGKLPNWFSRTTVRTDLVTSPVKRGDLRISVIATGNLDSASNVTLSSNVKGQTKIISIVPEGTQAYEGMVLVKLDASVYQDNLDQQVIALKQAESLRDQARDAVQIQQNLNESQIATAQLALDLADLDLEKYEKGDYPVLKTAAESKITLAKEKLAQSKDAYAFAKRQSKKGYVNQNELEQKRVAVTTAELDLQTAELELEVLENYQHKRDIAEKKSQAEQTKSELVREKQKAEAALNQAKADYEARVLTAEVEKTKHDKLVEQIAECTIVAPQSGQVIYAVSDSRRSQERVIEEGATVDNRQAIIKLPDLSQMQVDTRIHESKIGLVQADMPAIIKVSRKSSRFHNGYVKSVASVPNSPSWRQPDLREYTAVIYIETDDSSAEGLKPGLTAEVEIISDVLHDVLKIPVQALVARNGKHFVFVNKATGPEIRRVFAGATNDVETEVREIETPVADANFPVGLAEGEEVILAPRTSLPELFTVLEDAEPEKAVKQSDVPDSKGRSGRSGARDGKGSGKQQKGPGEKQKGEAPKKKSAAGAAGDPAAIFKVMDKNGDGVITKEEVAGSPMAAGFSKTDTNSDEKIDLAEFKVAAAAFAKKRGAGGGGGSQ